MAVTMAVLGSIISPVSGNEPAVISREAGWTRARNIVDFHQSEACLPKSSRLHELFFPEQMSNWRMENVVWSACYRALGRFKVGSRNYLHWETLERLLKSKL